MARRGLYYTTGTLKPSIGNVPDQLEKLDANQFDNRDPTGVAYEIAARLADEFNSGRRKAVSVSEVDGKPALETPMAAALVEVGFSRSSGGFLKRLG